MSRSPSYPRRGESDPLRLAILLLSLVTPLVTRAEPPAGYYATVDAGNPALLAATLHAVIDDHQRYPYTSTATDTWDILEIAQEDPNDSGAILDVYRNASYPKQGGGNSFYQREHTWPKSFGFPDDGSTNYAYTDAHMLHLADGSYNGARSNRPYGVCASTCASYETLSNDDQGGGSGPYPDDDNWSRSSGGLGGLLGRWETWSGRKGDVARALLYADVRYEGGVHGVTGIVEPDLVLTDDEAAISASNTGENESVAYMGLLSVILSWHAEDPVDEFERRRNDVVFAYQGNRNPFVDHPEWVASLYEAGSCVSDADCDDGVFCNGEETCSEGLCIVGEAPCVDPFVCSEAGATCSLSAGDRVWINELHYDNDGADTGEFFEIAGAAGSSLAGWSLVGYNGANGEAYASVSLSGTIPDQGGCAGTLAFDFAGMQNGAPDGLALVDAQGQLVEFLSYEGSLSATAGPAVGEVAIDIGVSESSSTPIGYSLQRAGAGSSAADFAWQPHAPESRGSPNSGQSLLLCEPVEIPSRGWPGAVFLVAGLTVLGTALLSDQLVAGR